MGNNAIKSAQLGMPIGTASARLRKALLFDMTKQLKLNRCFRCGKQIRNINTFSIEHKISWQTSQNPVKMFFDLNNIAFSHFSCNCGHGKRQTPDNIHGRHRMYSRGCRCSECKKAHAIHNRKYRM